MTGGPLHPLPQDALGAAAALYPAAPEGFPLIRAVLEARQPGAVFADDPSAPRLALILTGFGFAHAVGDVEGEGPADALTGALAGHPALKGRYVLWYDPPAACRARLEALPEARARTRTRIRYRHAGAPSTDAPADGASVALVDAETFPALDMFGLDLGARFWRSPEAFLREGLAALVTVDARPASLCYAAAVAGGEAEVDVATLEDFKGRGLARRACAAFIAACRERGVAPTWDCFDYNEPSVRLAASLGSEEVRRYPFTTFNT
ncbi:MAG: GNAT family N-acetyltransferase [Caulobacterales bacterium]|nr:GNAT family N-acetyltransferase [Caulobacterales bacterium]